MRRIDFVRTQSLVGVEGFEPSMLLRAPGLRPGRATSRPSTPTPGGDDPIRTDGAQGRAALAMQCLSPAQPRLRNIHWWGWRESNSHARGAGF